MAGGGNLLAGPGDASVYFRSCLEFEIDIGFGELIGKEKQPGGRLSKLINIKELCDFNLRHEIFQMILYAFQ